MRIAILGWGSLLWEGGTEFDSWHGDWALDGPALKIEFCRISQTRLGALTLVIDDEHGTPTTVGWCVSKRTKLDDAMCDLRSREGTTLDQIGRIAIPQRANPTTATPANAAIENWAQGKELAAVIWTALGSNFQEKTKQRFSVDAAITHLKSLPPEAKAKAAEYIWRAPRFVNTPLRAAMEVPPWFLESIKS
jgi:hypothetical protein